MNRRQCRPAEADGNEHQPDLKNRGMDQCRFDIGLYQTDQPGIGGRQHAGNDQPDHQIRYLRQQR